MNLFSVVTTCVKDNHSHTNTMLFSRQEKADECFDLIKKQFLTEYASELEEPTAELDNIFIAKGSPCANFNEFKMTLSKHITCDSDEYLSQFGDYKPIYAIATDSIKAKKHPYTWEHNGKAYNVRDVYLKGEDEHVTIASKELERDLFDEDFNEKFNGAYQIDEIFYGYTDDDIITNMTADEFEKYANENFG